MSCSIKMQSCILSYICESEYTLKKKTVLKTILLTQMQGRKASLKKILKNPRWNMKLKLPPLTCSSVWWPNTSIKEIWRMCNGWTKIYGCVFIFNLIVILFRDWTVDDKNSPPPPHTHTHTHTIVSYQMQEIVIKVWG